MSRKVAYSAILVALAMIFSYVEVLIPVNFGIPGIKLGLANLIVVAGLYFLRPTEVLLVSVTRILLVGFLFGNGMSIIYSLAGGLLSFAAMMLLKKAKEFSVVGVITGTLIGIVSGRVLPVVQRESHRKWQNRYFFD